MSLICHAFINGEYYQECHTWEEVNSTPVDAYMLFLSGTWYVKLLGCREHVHAWDVPKEYRTMALLLTS